MTGTRTSRLAWLIVLVLLGSLAITPDARADAAGPTDYNTEIVSIEPATSEFRVEMIGGDAFLRLEQLEPAEIIVIGYQGEPYLRFEPGGTVFENRRSPSVWLNQERYGTEEVPEFADPQASPQWAPVADNGRYAWHDHRSHWMNPQKPPGAGAGDQVLEATVPLLVDGRSVTVTVASYLLESPSKAPSILGVVVAAGFGVLSRTFSRARRSHVAVIAGSLALWLGVTAFGSVPTETEPSQLLWLLPALTVGASVVLALIHKRMATTVYLDGLAVSAGGTLAAWGVFRRAALTKPLIPSDAPATIDRFVIAAALVVGLVIAAHGLIGLVRPERLIETSHAKE